MNAKISVLIALITWLLLIFYYRKSIKKEGANTIRYFYKKSLGVLNVSSNSFFFAAGIMIVLLYHSFQLPLSFDESYTFNYFTSRGLYHSLFTYPAPNNHVLHSVLTNISWALLGFTHSELSVRFPALLFCLFSVLFVYKLFLRQNYFASFFFTAAFLLSPNIIEFAFQARGYTMQIFFCLVSFYLATRTEIRGLHFKNRLIFLLFFTIMGLFTSPAYLYTAAAIGIVFIFSFYDAIKRNINFCLLMVVFWGLTVLLLYSPIIIHQGISAIVSNKFVLPVNEINIKIIAGHFIDIINYISLPFGMGWVLLLCFIIIGIKEKKFNYLWLLITPMLLMIFLKQLPFLRIFLPFGILITASVFSSISKIKVCKKTPVVVFFKNRLYGFLLMPLICCGSVYFFNNIHEKDDLSSSFEFRKLAPYLSRYDVLTDISNCDWYMMELTTAHHSLKNKPEFIRFQNGATINSADSFVLLTKYRIPEHKLVDSLYSLHHQTRWIQIGVSPH